MNREWIKIGLLFAIVAVAFCALVYVAHAQEPVKGGAWAGAPDYVLAWLQEQKDPYGRSCCGIGDSINVEVVSEDASGLALRVTNPRARTELAIGTIIHAQKDRLVKVNYDPDGNAVAWVSVGGAFVYCLSQPPKV